MSKLVLRIVSQSHPHGAARLALILFLLLLSPFVVNADVPPATQPSPSYDATADYEVQTIEGWTIRVNRRLLNEAPELAAKTRELLRFQLYQITREIPGPALEKIRGVVIWVELRDPQFPCMCYHHDVGWVTTHGLNPEKAHGVEIANCRTFLEWEHRQPWMVFHELAHAYHDLFLPDGFDNAEVLEAYTNAKEGKLYDAVLRNSGRTERAYAMTNQMEYFAECSEAFFGTNDFYPFVRPELREHDPRGFATLQKAWGLGRTVSTTQPSK